MSIPPIRPTSFPGLRRSAGLKLILICALASFVAIAATIYLTKDVDWYGGGSTKA